MTIEIDLAVLPSEHRYEDRYRNYVEIFERIAHTPADQEIKVYNPPGSWLPLLYHLRCVILYPRFVFDHCEMVCNAMGAGPQDRTAIEVLCNFRPETADCLWKCDMQWQTPPGRVRTYGRKQEFIVTTNGAYHRPEVKDFLSALDAYTPTKQKVLLVPCAADKPYPSPMHQACIDRLPDDFYIMNATGVLGLVPQDLWPQMCWYDSGIPNQWRLFQIAKDYFTKHEHKKIVVYCDFYAHVLKEAFHSIGILDNVEFVLPPVQYDDYVDLLDKDLLVKLAGVLCA